MLTYVHGHLPLPAERLDNEDQAPDREHARDLTQKEIAGPEAENDRRRRVAGAGLERGG